MKGYEIKINYTNANGQHQFTIEVGDKWDEEKILEQIQWDRELTGTIAEQVFEDKKYWQAFRDVKIFVDRMIWIQQLSNVEKGISRGTLISDDFKDIKQDYVDYDHFVNQSVMEISEETDQFLHESDFVLGKKSRTFDLGWFFTEECMTLKKTIAATFRYSDKLPKEYVRVGFEKIKVVKTTTGHLVPITSTGEILPYYTKEILDKDIDPTDAEWELFGCLKDTIGIETAQQIVFIGHKPSGGLDVGLQMVTRNRKVTSVVQNTKVSVKKNEYGYIKDYLIQEPSHQMLS